MTQPALLRPSLATVTVCWRCPSDLSSGDHPPTTTTATICQTVALCRQYTHAGRQPLKNYPNIFLAPDVTHTYAYDLVGGNGFLGSSATQNVNGDTFSTTFETDALGRLIEIQDDTQAATGEVRDILFSYDATGRLENTARSISATFDFETRQPYDGAGRLATLTHHRNGSTDSFVDYAYDYDDVSRITDISTAFDTTVGAFQYLDDLDSAGARTWSLNFDEAGQLTARNTNGVADDTFDYDENGNRLDANGAAYGTGANNRLKSDGAYGYDYDEEGNFLRKYIDVDDSNACSAGDELVAEYSWDNRNRLIETKQYSAGALNDTIEYRYNNADLRVRKEVTPNGSSSTVEQYAYDGDQLVLALDDTGKPTRRYLNRYPFLLGLPLPGGRWTRTGRLPRVMPYRRDH